LYNRKRPAPVRAGRFRDDSARMMRENV
jgi:hypothetical protein